MVLRLTVLLIVSSYIEDFTVDLRSLIFFSFQTFSLRRQTSLYRLYDEWLAPYEVPDCNLYKAKQVYVMHKSRVPIIQKMSDSR